MPRWPIKCPPYARPPNNPFATKEVEKYETNAEKAKELLQEVGVTDLKLNIAFSATDPAQTVQATLIQQQLQQAKQLDTQNVWIKEILLV